MVQITNVFNFLKRFDAYPKTLDDFRIKTYYGALSNVFKRIINFRSYVVVSVTIFSGILMFGLFCSELAYYLSIDVTSELLVDITLGQKLNVNLDITFPKLGCEFISMDAMDISGEQQLDVDHDIYKMKLDIDQNPLSDTIEKHELGQTTLSNNSGITKSTVILDPNRCESCYGAESHKIKCCNTCSLVREAYKAKGWALSEPHNIIQCSREGYTEKITITQKEGCKMFGVLKVNKVAGNFHIALGRSYQQHHIHIHDMQELAGQQFNLTHKINQLSFGEKYPGIVNPLDGKIEVADQSSIMFQYYIKIVPTTYIKIDGKELWTNQFSVTKHKKIPNIGEQSLPGVFISYELSPMMVKHTESRRSFMHFLTSLCAIIGGVFTVAGLLDSLIYNSGKIIQKFQMGKLS